MGHEHHHHSPVKNLRLAFFLNLGFTLLELVGGWYVNSVAIVSDAIHDLGDSISLGTSWYLEIKAKKKPSSNYSFGYKRFSLLGALINSIVLILGSGVIIHEAIQRLLEPEFSDAKGMILLSFIGISVNGYAAWKVHKGKTMNEKVISWHLLEDVLGWVAILLGSIILYFYPTPYLDPVLSLGITLYILWNVIQRFKETIGLFLQKSPSDINPKEIEEEIKKLQHVQSIHHTHIWSLDGAHHVFTTHVKLVGISSLEQIIEVKDGIRNLMKKYPFDHYTIETELDEENCLLIEKEGKD
ncbi:cobalt-zinc-cadmium efflux system protein [Algoriphagus boseongensis]|uniref:Cobalt-zinc-cadmium efflux system protein n=1 Tax=Algoriphagus boseongensis TaxID=1442587 RepID=A0A4R6T7T6_9BACT|nr:cation diffusion facilitator family transporter [Algoriphagus boseongensis]TDQ16998.1 cobalt-zinc-cadmium efflux system protein [Algoriphagus boseongensis]